MEPTIGRIVLYQPYSGGQGPSPALIVKVDPLTRKCALTVFGNQGPYMMWGVMQAPADLISEQCRLPSGGWAWPQDAAMVPGALQGNPVEALHATMSHQGGAAGSSPGKAIVGGGDGLASAHRGQPQPPDTITNAGRS